MATMLQLMQQCTTERVKEVGARGTPTCGHRILASGPLSVTSHFSTS